MFDQRVLELAEQLVTRATGLGMWITTAESCTGGLIAGALTSVSGASSCVGSGFVTYSNDAKMDALGVSFDSLEKYGAVSEEVAREMAHGAKKTARADLALAVTGIAGPLGGTSEKPVGLVFIAAAGGTDPEKIVVERHEFGNIGRSEVRIATVVAALELGLRSLHISS